MNVLLRIIPILLFASVIGMQVEAQPPGRGRGLGQGRGHGRGHGHDERHDQDHKDFRFLLTNHEKIKREVKQLPSGVETVTETDDPEIASKIKEHVKWMKYRVEETKPIRMRDPLFAELFRNTDKIKMVVLETKKGVRVRETSDDPYVAKLIQAHAKAVSGFVARGFDEAMKNHPVPGQDEAAVAKPISPAIDSYGQVVSLPNAAQQPRVESKIVVDLTESGEPDKLNPAVEKVARFVNIYRGAGKEAADVEIAVVLHGDATVAVLNADAYSRRFGSTGNPNLDCLHELHEAGVTIYVCGQSLVGKDFQPEDVVVFADVAVSALTALVNLQTDGYAYIGLTK